MEKKIKKVRIKDCTKILKLFNENDHKKIWEKIKQDFKEYNWDKAEISIESPFSMYILFENFRKVN
jgi:hypothetical protein